jgi:hypothetical protein
LAVRLEIVDGLLRELHSISCRRALRKCNWFAPSVWTGPCEDDFIGTAARRGSHRRYGQCPARLVHRLAVRLGIVDGLLRELHSIPCRRALRKYAGSCRRYGLALRGWFIGWRSRVVVHTAGLDSALRGLGQRLAVCLGFVDWFPRELHSNPCRRALRKLASWFTPSYSALRGLDRGQCPARTGSRGRRVSGSLTGSCESSIRFLVVALPRSLRGSRRWTVPCEDWIGVSALRGLAHVDGVSRDR